MMLHFVKPGSTSAYEGVMERLGEALRMSENTETDRRAQAAGWTVYRANVDISGQGSAMYVWVIDPVIDGADYAVSTILTEGFRGAAQEFRDVYSDSLTDAPLQRLPINLSLVHAPPVARFRFSDHVTVLLHFVKRGSEPAYENVVQRIGEAHQGGSSVARRSQAFRWKVFRAVGNITGRDDVMYVWLLDVAIEAAGDAVSRVMMDLFATEEFQALSETYGGLLAEIERSELQIDLSLVKDLRTQVSSGRRIGPSVWRAGQQGRESAQGDGAEGGELLPRWGAVVLAEPAARLLWPASTPDATVRVPATRHEEPSRRATQVDQGEAVLATCARRRREAACGGYWTPACRPP